MNKSTIYKYYREVKGKTMRRINMPKEESFIGEFIGLFAGDGNFYYDKKTGHYRIRFFFNIKEKKFVDELSRIFSENLSKKPSINRTKNVLVMRYYSKELSEFIRAYLGWGVSRNKNGANLKSRTVFLKNRLHNRDFKIGFLRGFLDSDGYLSEKKILFGSASEKIIKQVENFLIDLGIRAYKLSKYEREGRVGIWHLYIHKKERQRLLNLIKPRNTILIKKYAPAGIRTRVASLEGWNRNHLITGA